MRLPQSEGLTVEQSTFVEGELGVIARRDYQKGEVLFKVEGPIRTRPTKYSFAIALDQHIEPQREDGVSDFGHYLNHSCDPNVIVKPVAESASHPRIDVIARRAIMAGEELAFDYASLEYEITATNTLCRCNTPACRKTIHGFKDLPRRVVEQYEQEGLIPDYLLRFSKS